MTRVGITGGFGGQTPQFNLQPSLIYDRDLIIEMPDAQAIFF
jgi:hypothetical protein